MNDMMGSASAVDSATAAVSAWEDPPRVGRTDAAPVLAVDGFEGPLDWWLESWRWRVRKRSIWRSCPLRP
jgi:hypothetical protein